MPALSSRYAATCTGEPAMTVRLPLWAGPDSVRDACMCVQPPLYTTCLQNKHDHSLYMGPPIICPSAHVGWTGPDQTVCACVANFVFYSCSHSVQVWRVPIVFKCGAFRPPIWAGPDSAMSDDESCCSAPSLVNSDNDNLVSESGYVVVRGCSTMTTWSVSDVFIVSRADDGDLVSESDDEDSDPPWRLFAACEWASFAHRLLLRQELRDKHYMMRRSPKCSKFTWIRQELRQELHGCPRHGICVTQFCPGHGQEHIDQTFSMTAIFVDTVMGRRPITRWHYGRLLWALTTGRHPLSTTHRVKLYLNGRNSNFPY